MSAKGVETLSARDLQYEVEQFLYREAQLLDDRRFADWVDLFSDDCFYRMPIRESTPDNPSGLPAEDDDTIVRHIDDDKVGLRRRLVKLENPAAHSEVPPSRTRRQVSNVRVARLANGEVDVRSNFSLFQSRRETAEFLFVGERHDRLRRVGDDWRITRRTIIIDHSILPRSLSVFF